MSARRAAPAVTVEPEPELVGVREVADRFGVLPATVHMWQYRSARGQLPHPTPDARWRIGGADVWLWSQWAEWGAASGRPC